MVGLLKTIGHYVDLSVIGHSRPKLTDVCKNGEDIICLSETEFNSPAVMKYLLELPPNPQIKKPSFLKAYRHVCGSQFLLRGYQFLHNSMENECQLDSNKCMTFFLKHGSVFERNLRFSNCWISSNGEKISRSLDGWTFQYVVFIYNTVIFAHNPPPKKFN